MRSTRKPGRQIVQELAIATLSSSEGNACWVAPPTTLFELETTACESGGIHRICAVDEISYTHSSRQATPDKRAAPGKITNNISECPERKGT